MTTTLTCSILTVPLTRSTNPEKLRSRATENKEKARRLPYLAYGLPEKGLFTLEEFERLAADALQVREQLNPRNTDQAFFNYCCDMKPVALWSCCRSDG